MDEQGLLGRVFGVGLPGPEVDTSAESGLRDLAPGAVVLFARNLRSGGQTRDLVAGLREIAGAPLLVAIDQEGGRVSRLAALASDLRLPTAARLGSLGGDETRTFAEATARSLAALDIDWDFAPVADLDEPGNPSGVGDRSFGRDHGRATHHAGRFLEGLHAGGVLGCLKHFPGLGHTRVDTHRALAVCTRSERDLWEADLRPYRDLGDLVDAVMVSHAAYPQATGGPETSATLSRQIVTGWLRERIGFAGAAVSDDMEMGALPAGRDAANTRDALVAGCDLVLFCSDGDRARRSRDGLADDLAAGRVARERLVEAGTRVAVLHERLAAVRRDAGTAPDLESALGALRDAAQV